ncbi:MAG TPA: RHS repeat domain-containing protein [Chitinophaga sp.]|uniref:RHS repeat domain-containing protein n=1 Tax=Chitinophaga sp. TaxID=1869181 RepID=UPI002CFE22C1|nr:RHS repeat domain-containing protein [Chitinophaga sp.]HVI49451.1 RHS repeat domain-containing protein [Chitinophaga sp.]
MKKYLYALLIPILISACSTRNNKQTAHLTAITIHGDTIPQYTFRYDKAGHLVELVKHNGALDTNTTIYTYDSSNRLAGMTTVHRNGCSKQVLRQAVVKSWDKDGNISTIAYSGQANEPAHTVSINWERGLPVAMKCSDSSQVSSWSYNKDGNMDWRNLCADTVTGTDKDTSIFYRSASYEWEDSLNPLQPIINNLVLGPGITPVPAPGPFVSMEYILMHLSTHNPFLIKLEEKEKSTCKGYSQEYLRHSTLQFSYAYNSNGYPKETYVHLHTEGWTKLASDTHVRLDYAYE